MIGIRCRRLAISTTVIVFTFSLSLITIDAGAQTFGLRGRTPPVRSEELCLQGIIKGSDIGPNVIFDDQMDLDGSLFAVRTQLGNSETGFGTVHLFRRRGGQWTEEARLANDPGDGPGSLFGADLVVQGDAVFVTGTSFLGRFMRVFRLQRSTGTWAIEQTVYFADDQIDFTLEIEVDGDVLVMTGVGALEGELPRQLAIVYRFHPESGQWLFETILPVSEPGNTALVNGSNRFAVSGDVIVTGYGLGVFDPVIGYQGEPGFSYVYRYQHDNGQWLREAVLDESLPFFGQRVAVEDDLITVSSALSEPSEEIFIYRHLTGQWIREDVLSPPDGESYGVNPDSLIRDGLIFVRGTFLDETGNESPHVYRYGKKGNHWEFAAPSVGRSEALRRGSVFDVDGEFIALGGIRITLPNGVITRAVYFYGGLQEIDCNNNGLVDVCEFADGSMTDCNANGIPDECEEDCNGNGVPDECELTRVDVDSGQLGPFGAGAPGTLMIPNAPLALTPVRIEVSSSADLEGAGKSVEVRFMGFPIGTLFADDGQACSDRPQSGVIEYPTAFYNFLLQFDPDRTARFEVITSDGVDAAACATGSHVRIRVSYRGEDIGDADGNGVLDECDPPLCEGLAATIYVDPTGTIMGGLLDGRRYFGILIGTPGDDVMVGTPGSDIIIGMSGDDVICGNGGDDLIINPPMQKPGIRAIRVGERRALR